MTDDLAAKAADFARELGETLATTLPQAPSVDVQAVEGESTFIVQPANPDGSAARVPLFVNGEKLAELSIVLYLEMDRTGAFLKNVRTDCAAYSVLDRQPLFRMDYRADMQSAPVAHWQFHAERGALTHLLSMAQAHRPKSVESPHMLSRLHFSGRRRTLPPLFRGCDPVRYRRVRRRHGCWVGQGRGGGSRTVAPHSAANRSTRSPAGSGRYPPTGGLDRYSSDRQ